MKFSDVKTYLETELAALRTLSDDAKYSPVPPINPGPASNAPLQKISSQMIVFATVGAGAGLTMESLFDRPFITIRAIGLQQDYESAETLAQDIDRILLTRRAGGTIGSAKVLYVTRTSGAPALLEQDLANRYHFTCDYITETQTGF